MTLAAEVCEQLYCSTTVLRPSDVSIGRVSMAAPSYTA